MTLKNGFVGGFSHRAKQVNAISKFGNLKGGADVNARLDQCLGDDGTDVGVELDRFEDQVHFPNGAGARVHEVWDEARTDVRVLET